ncbi:MAG: hypothetical protein ACWA5P_01925 [bacterium]
MRKLGLTIIALFVLTFFNCSVEQDELNVVEIYYDGLRAIEVINGEEKEIELPSERAGANITWLIQRERPSGAVLFGLNFGKLEGDVYNGVPVESTTTDKQIRIRGDVSIAYDYMRISGDETVTVNFYSNVIETDGEDDNVPCQFIFRGGANEVQGKVAYIASSGEVADTMLQANELNEGLFNPLNPSPEDSINN